LSNYTKSTNFATKDNLSPGDPLKIVRGTEIDTEFNNISTAISTKTDNSAAAITGGSITGITDLAVADGGTGASTAAGALNNLLPSQTSNANKYLQTDGTNATWDAVSLSTSDITGTLPVANGGTGVTSSTGTGNVVLSNSPTLVTPILGTPQSGNFSTGTFTWPTFNQNTTGTAAGLSATLATTSGGTGLTSFTSGGVVYASSTSALATSSALTFDGNNLGLGGALNAGWANSRVFQTDPTFSAISTDTASDGNLSLSWNAYATAADTWKYRNTGLTANRYRIAQGTFQWYTAASGTAGDTISFTQSLAVGKGTSLALEGATSQSGTGITFPATQSASSDANTLDDYEEGTWTPSFTFLTAGDFSATYSQQVGTYTRIGNRVTVNCTIVSTAFTFTTASGSFRVLGLPFTSEGTSGNQSHGALATTGVTYTLGYTMVVSNIPPSTAFIAFTQSSTAAALGGLTVANFVSGTNVTIRTTITYQV
jgi:hypothetical protein